MTAEKPWATLGHYRTTLESLGHPPARMSSEECASTLVSTTVLFGHCCWMADYCLGPIRAEYDAGRSEAVGKAMRWLGYIQGVLNARGLYSCADLRDHSRGDV